MLLAPVVWALTVGVAYFFFAKTWWFPPPISQHGQAYDEQFMRTLVVVGIIFILAQFALGYVILPLQEQRRPRQLLARQQSPGNHLDQRHGAAISEPGGDGQQGLGECPLR